MDAALRDQLLTAFEDTYFSPLKYPFTGYSVIPMLQLIGHFYGHYSRISDMSLTANKSKL